MPRFRSNTMRYIALCLVGIVGILHWFHPPVLADVSQSPTHFYATNDQQTVSITFTNTTGQTVTELNAYSDQTYVQMGEGSAYLDTCSTAERMDAGNWKFSECSVGPGEVVTGSFPIIAANGEYTENDLSMNFTYGEASNQVFVTISGSPSVSSTSTPTQAPTSSTSSVPIVITATPQPTVKPTPTPIPDRVGPTIHVSTNISKPFAVPPKVEGTISDLSGVLSVSYSIDGGKNYIPVDAVAGAKIKTFAFTPRVTLDDNYGIVIRGIDGAGNASTYSAGTLIIDRMPPRIGAALISLGSIGIDEVQGVISLIAGIPYRLTVSAVGGPISMKVRASNSLDESVLIKNTDTGLWEGTIVLHDALGDAQLSVIARDGAQNVVTSDVVSLHGIVSGRISDGQSSLSGVRIKVFVKNTRGVFVRWNSAEYSQKIMDETDEHGAYAYMLPSGTYYVEYAKDGYKTVKSRIFTFEKPSVVSANVHMYPRQGFWIAGRWFIPLFDTKTYTIDIQAAAQQENAPVSLAHVGEALAYVPFVYNGSPISYLSLRGKPTLITFLTSWSPAAIAQISVINQLASNANINVMGVFSQQTDSSVAIIAKRGLYRVALVADPDGIASEAVSLHSVPMHIILDRTGIIRKMYTGFMNETALLDALVQ